ncbi:hypothetical protein Acr_24g0007580 [Actinidia rufa]|uniref:DUF4283 domain-containing protein n=1 Tax=Actinidia rufa TaxID=165716 RepID=A0A7J0GUW5_9ERIC|nr:hypothetical protein Acr_24g0007580 [Actinidia rufa]
MFNNEVSEEAESNPEVPEDKNASIEKTYEGDTSGGHGTEGEPTERHSEDVSTLGIRQNAQLKSMIAQGETSVAGDDRAMEKATKEGMKKSFVSLFEKNRLPSNGSKLEFYNLEDGPIQLQQEDTQLSACPWERCLVGYFGGRFPGKHALNQIVASWKVHPSIQFHGSGWIIFQFGSKEEQEQVLENGPYMIYGCPLLLKQMEKYFSFGKEGISTFPALFLIDIGIPMADSRLTIPQYTPLIDRISDSISAWAGATLSYAGRTELIKSVLQGVECYWLSILPIPVGVKSKIVQFCRNFIWSGKCTINTKPLVAWKEVTLPKVEGGLGLWNSKAWNKALLSKTLWNIQAKKDSIWFQWVHQVYMKGGCFWGYKIKHADSPLLKQIMSLRDEIIGAETTVERAAIRLNQWAPNGKF